jgi:hypothetical protein
MSLLDRFHLTVPLIQAPMAGVSTPLLAASVCEAGALGSIAVGATDAAGARAMIEELRSRTGRAFNVNLFVHGSPKADPEREAAWLEWLAPLFADFGAVPPTALRTIYKSFADDPDMLAMLLELAPPVISFHFGLPSVAVLSALRDRGIYLMATATSLEEARAIEAAVTGACSTPARRTMHWAPWRLRGCWCGGANCRSSQAAGSWMGPASPPHSISGRLRRNSAPHSWHARSPPRTRRTARR